MEGRWVVGRRPVAEALAAGRAVEVMTSGPAAERWLLTLSGPRPPLRRATPAEIERLAAGAVHQGVAARVGGPLRSSLDEVLARAAAADEAALVVIAAGLQDPRNLGALARTAEAAGAHGLVVPERRSAPLGPVAEKAAAGAFAYLPVVEVTNLARAVADCQAAGLWAFAADPRGEKLYTAVDWAVPVALVVGGEGAGVPRLVRDRCDVRVRLPMRGRIGSLNASVAAGVLLYEVVRQRSRV